MKRSFIETVIGGLVIAVAGIFLFYAYQNSTFANRGGYEVKAQFLSIGGLTVGSDIRIGGVKIGSVSELELDQEDYLAIVTLSIDDKVKLPDDTEVSIVSDGLLGGRYVSLAPGSSKTYIVAGDELKNTKDVRTVEQILGEAIYVIANQGGASDDEKK